MPNTSLGYRQVLRRQLAAGKSPHYMAVYHNLPLSAIQNIINDLNQE